MKTTPVSVKVPDGHKSVIQVGYKPPKNCDTVHQIRANNRPRWKIWLPRYLYLYVTFEKSDNQETPT